MSDISAMMSELSGSARRVNSESDVKTFAVSRVLAPLPFAARSENTVKARMGDKTGEIYAVPGQYRVSRISNCNLTYEHGPDQQLSELLGDAELIDPEPLQVFAQDVGKSAHFDTFHGIQHRRSGCNTTLDSFEPERLT
jgi:hypothetical protein